MVNGFNNEKCSTTYIETMTIRNWWKIFLEAGILYLNFSCSKYIYLIFYFLWIIYLEEGQPPEFQESS